MIRQRVKSTIGKAFRRTYHYVQSLDAANNNGASHDSPSIDDPSRYEFVYLWLNSILTTLEREEPGVLRPNYTWGVLQGVHLAKAIGIDRVSVIEFGVAGGNGLMALERAAERIEKIVGVGIDVYGFDTGRGLPEPVDYRDCPNLWTGGSFAMDQEALQSRLRRAHLVLGAIDETISGFIRSKPSPVAFISFDMDYYSSTMQSLALLDAEEALLLPRIYCYFDDIIGFTYSEYTGERLAIGDFNSSHEHRKMSPIYGLRYFLPPAHAQAEWAEQFYIAHLFDHSLYCRQDASVRTVPKGHSLTDLDSHGRRI